MRTRDVAIGEFVGPYHYVAAAEPHARHRRAVSWIASDVDRDAFESDLLSTLNGQHTVQEFKAVGAVRRLRSLADEGVDPDRRSALMEQARIPDLDLATVR